MARHYLRYLLVLVGLVWPATALAASADDYDHDRFVTQPVDAVRDFEAFKVSFDTDQDVDGIALGVPDWVAYELRRDERAGGKSYKRPSRWSTDPDLHQRGIAPDDSSYRNSGYSRGHMCMKSHASRMGAAAGRETHTVLNACPQMQRMNGGIWLAIEYLTGRWANEQGAVWIVTGPVFTEASRNWIGDPGEVRVAVPDAFFKIVVRDTGQAVEALAFLVPMYGDANHARSSGDVRPYLTSIDAIEALSGLDFLSALPDAKEAVLEREIATQLWAAPARPVSVRDASKPTPTADDAAPSVTRAKGLRAGRDASEADIAIATELVTRGWTFVMPRPKSSAAKWGNTDARTTWWSGYWKNGDLDLVSTAQPSESDGFKGDGEQPGWRRGGSPASPSDVEWLCSESGGPVSGG